MIFAYWQAVNGIARTSKVVMRIFFFMPVYFKIKGAVMQQALWHYKNKQQEKRWTFHLIILLLGFALLLQPGFFTIEILVGIDEHFFHAIHA